ncbi:MAG: hypothetical protein R3F19_20390 [Verrucomicrobiales bacterium]|nr:hypothetical protein [Verrucomicrobiae bacterium]
MKNIRVATAAIALALSAFTTLRVSADEDLPDHNLSEWRVGDVLVGEKVDLKQAEGKVVAIEFWGTR